MFTENNKLEAFYNKMAKGSISCMSAYMCVVSVLEIIIRSKCEEYFRLDVIDYRKEVTC